MDINQWFGLIISLVLSGVGIYMAYQSGVLLAKIEEQNRHFDETMRLFVDRLVQAQTELLTIAILGKSKVADSATDNQDKDVMKQIERLRREVLSQIDTD